MTRIVSPASDGRNAAKVLDFYRRIDVQDMPAELFAADFQFHSPKYGIGTGFADLAEMGAGFASAYRDVSHTIDLVVEAENLVVAEGVTAGEDVNGNRWRGGETPGGRFCTVFEFDGDGLIARMHIHLDPDYTSQDLARFHWDRGGAARW